MSKLITKREIAFQQREIAKNRLKNMMSEIAHQESLPKVGKGCYAASSAEEPKPEKGKTSSRAVGRPRGSIEKDTYKQPPPASERGLPKEEEVETEPEEEEDEEEETEYEEEDVEESESFDEEEDEEDEQDIIYVQKKKAPQKIKKIVEKVQKPNATPSRGKGKTKVSDKPARAGQDEDIRKALLDLIQNMQTPSRVEQTVEQPKSNLPPPPSSLPYKRETVQMAYNSLLF